MESYSICPFEAGLFHLAEYPQGSSMLWQVSKFPSFLMIFHCMDRPYFVYPFIYGHLSYFHLLATVNIASMNMGVQISLQDPAFNSFGSIPILLNHVVILFLIF